ncbi:MAG: hypothetical protein OXN17_07450 [Candidatus Poribacteria bacterium]|nr:hypothetical protein [Candidatus Poribacteria bacterium]MDE0502724.1 hypothetical protein [Candidatus Poribacteria bacterium]
MEFSEDEKKELEKKYKEQRRSMWSGKRKSSVASEERPEETTVPSQSIAGQSKRTRLKSNAVARQNRENTVSTTDYSDTQQMIQKIRQQREDTWQGNNAATRSRQRHRWRATTGRVGKFWNPPQLEDIKKTRRWKLALGVFGAVSVLVGVGILLGYWFAG